ncbi:MAG: hypothetical protein RMI94_11595, partial [Bryobacterales bacterium]|nr:hypothetical protein [Bryobacterales bacterium]
MLKMIRWLTAFLLGVLVGDPPPRFPMPNDYTNSIKTRWLSKPVLASTLLDDAESLASWKLVNSGQARGQLLLSREKALSGSSSLLLTSPTTGDKPIPTTRYYGAAGALHVVEG